MIKSNKICWIFIVLILFVKALTQNSVSKNNATVQSTRHNDFIKETAWQFQPSLHTAYSILYTNPNTNPSLTIKH